MIVYFTLNINSDEFYTTFVKERQVFIIIRSLYTKSYNRIITLALTLLVAGTVLFSNDIQAAVIKTPKLNVKNLSMKKNSSYKLRVYNMDRDYSVTFSTSDSSVVTIKAFSTSARLKAKASGTAIVTATVTDDEDQIINQLDCRVTVTPPAISAKFVKKRVTLSPGQSRKLKISLKPSTAFEQLRYTSDNPDIVSISSNGTVTANSVGSTVVRVSIENGKGGSCKIHVIDRNSANNIPDNSIPDSSISDKSAGNNTGSGSNANLNTSGAATPTATPVPKNESGTNRARQISE